MEYSFLIQLPLLFFSIIVHEYSHGAVANYFGDDTARLSGRLTFNPLPHVDPIGTILLPLLCYATSAPLFGWAKPVPVNEFRLRSRPKSMLLVAAVGPLSNFFLASFCAVGLWFTVAAARGTGYFYLLAQTLQYGILVNLYLFVFNLLPVHPLDGSKVIVHLLPSPMAEAFERLAPHGFLIIMLLLFTGLFARIVTPVVYWLYRMLTAGLA